MTVVENANDTFETAVGTIVGWKDNGVIRATGIPYATAERFQPPVPTPLSPLPFFATSWAPACPQARVPFLDEVLGSPLIDHLRTDEHCQHLSITLPADVSLNEKLAVMVWIHGGSYKSGAGDALVYDPSALVREQRVIVVSVTYRIGLFGFLGGYEGRTANLGLLDLIEALRWLNTNITAFGGDVNKITLFGHSAGGDAVAHLMIAEGTAGLFQRVVIQSAPLGISLGRKKMAEAMGRIAAGISVSDTPADVVGKQDAVVAAAKGFGLKAGMAFGTQYGYAPLPNEEHSAKAWENNAPSFDLLIGSTKEETALFLARMKDLRRLTQIPFAGKPLRSLLVRLTTDRIYRKAAVQFARRHAKGGGNAYLYTIRWGSATNDFGAAHTVDLPLLFGNQATWQGSELLKGIPWSELDENGKRVRALWAEFARSGKLPQESPIPPAVLCYERV